MHIPKLIANYGQSHRLQMLIQEKESRINEELQRLMAMPEAKTFMRTRGIKPEKLQESCLFMAALRGNDDVQFRGKDLKEAIQDNLDESSMRMAIQAMQA